MGLRDKPGEFRIIPRRFRKNLFGRTYPECPFCGETPKYPAHKNFCKKNPDSKANREAVKEQAKADYVKHGVEEKVKAGNVKHRDRLVENGKRVMARIHSRKNKHYTPRSKGKKWTVEQRANLSRIFKEKNLLKASENLKKAMKSGGLVAPQIVDDRPSIFEDDFFRKPSHGSGGWVEVETWTNEDFDPFA